MHPNIHKELKRARLLKQPVLPKDHFTILRFWSHVRNELSILMAYPDLHEGTLNNEMFITWYAFVGKEDWNPWPDGVKHRRSDVEAVILNAFTTKDAQPPSILASFHLGKRGLTRSQTSAYDIATHFAKEELDAHKLSQILRELYTNKVEIFDPFNL